MVHKAVLDVAEEGTEAAAATGVTAVFRSIKLPLLLVEFDRPFLIQIFQKEYNLQLFHQFRLTSLTPLE